MTSHQTTTPTTMVYDGDGNRVSESVGGATTKYLVDTLNPTGLPQVLDENGQRLRDADVRLWSGSCQRKPTERFNLDAKLLRLRRSRQRAVSDELDRHGD